MAKPKAVSVTQPAYHNRAFLESADGRPLRILAEYLEPMARLNSEGIERLVVFFGSARINEDDPLGAYYSQARQLAQLITEWSLTLPQKERLVVCSGGGGGIMEAANRGAREAGGSSVGFNIRLPHEQQANPYLTPELHFEFHYFFMRKLWFTHLARAIVVFPGGFGTLDELLDALTLMQTGKMAKIPLILFGQEYWDDILSIENLAKHRMISAEDVQLIHKFASVPLAFKFLKNYLISTK